MQQLIVGLRLFRQKDAQFAIHCLHQKGLPNERLVDIGVERLYPALKNIIGFHQINGHLAPTRIGTAILTSDTNSHAPFYEKRECRLYFCLIETDQSCDFWKSRDEVEFLIQFDEFSDYLSRIRGRSGTAYIDACEQFAQSSTFITDSYIFYQPPGRLSEERKPALA